jgi:hypothetical protein
VTTTKSLKACKTRKWCICLNKTTSVGTKTVEQILSEITEGSIVVDTDETLTNPDNVMQRSMGHFENIILIGTNEDGHMEVRSSLNLTVKDMLWMLEMTKQNILLTALSHDEDDEDE